MIYFVTGATGFIGKRLVAKLLEKPAATVYFLTRDNSPERLAALYACWGVDKTRAIPITPPREAYCRRRLSRSILSCASASICCSSAIVCSIAVCCSTSSASRWWMRDCRCRICSTFAPSSSS